MNFFPMGHVDPVKANPDPSEADKRWEAIIQFLHKHQWVHLSVFVKFDQEMPLLPVPIQQVYRTRRGEIENGKWWIFQRGIEVHWLCFSLFFLVKCAPELLKTAAEQIEEHNRAVLAKAKAEEIKRNLSGDDE